MSSNKIDVSVVIPVFNSSKTLIECLDSLLNQSFRNWEAICVNDGCTDNSVDIIEKYCKMDSRFVLIHQDNAKQAVARNNGIINAKGKYIAFLDSDDVAYPERLKLQFYFMENNPEVFVLGGARKNIDSISGSFVSEFKHPLDDKILRKNIIWHSPFSTSCVMLRREVFNSYSFSASYTPVEDYKLWLDISSNNNYKFANLPDLLVEYKQRSKIPRRSYFLQILVKFEYLYEKRRFIEIPVHTIYIFLSLVKDRIKNAIIFFVK